MSLAFSMVSHGFFLEVIWRLRCEWLAKTTWNFWWRQVYSCQCQRIEQSMHMEATMPNDQRCPTIFILAYSYKNYKEFIALLPSKFYALLFFSKIAIIILKGRKFIKDLRNSPKKNLKNKERNFILACC